MAMMYGPQAYRPNPSGITLNSRPGQFQMPAMAPPVPAAPGMAPSVLSFNDWLAGLQGGAAGAYVKANGPYNNRGQDIRRPAYGTVRSQYDDYRLDTLSGQPGGMGAMGGGASSPVAGALSLDPTAMAYMKHLNGG